MTRRMLLLACLMGASGCKKETPVAPAAPAGTAGAERRDGFEAHVEGHLRGSLEAARYLVVLSHEPCDPRRLYAARHSCLGHPDAADPDKDFFLEAIVHADVPQHLCGAGLDASGTRIVSFGAYPGNPLRFVPPPPGEDERELEDLDFPLVALPAPVVMPDARF